MVDLSARHARVAGDVERRVADVLRSGRYVGGPVVAQAEQAVADLLRRRFGVGVGSGTDALTLALRALGIGSGHQVIVPAVSFFATVESVLHTGAQPVLVDVLPDAPLLDPDAALAAVTPATRAIVAVHLFGNVACAPDTDIAIVDDSAQAVGTDPPPARGVLGAVSFYPTKVLGGAGDGGLVVTDEQALAQAVRRLGSHGMSAPNVHHRVAGHVGGNSHLDAVQAAVLLGHLPDLAVRIARRRQIAARYDAAFAGMTIPRDPGSTISVYVLRHPRRDALRSALGARGIASAVYYPMAMTAQAVIGGSPADARRRTPNAVAFCDQALALPCHADLTDADVARVTAAVLGAA